ncbi:MAG: hypothetical protein ACK6A7_10470 [Planctomycetota bacterium]
MTPYKKRVTAFTQRMAAGQVMPSLPRGDAMHREGATSEVARVVLWSRASCLV